MLRIATFNVENLDDKVDERNPPLEARVPVLRGAFERIAADIICLQEVHGQELDGHTSEDPQRNFAALDAVLEGTRFESFKRAHTKTTQGVPYDVRNLLVLVDPRFELEFDQIRNSEIDKLQYRRVTANPPEDEAKDVTWERPILHAKVGVPGRGTLHVVNLHLKSRLSSNIPGQRDGFRWKSAAGWAEGYFLSSMKRVGQALETRVLVDKIFDEDPKAQVVVCGDFNAEPGEVPVEAICGRVENTDNSELRYRALIPCSNTLADSLRYTLFHHGQPNLLDHMLISQSMLPYLRGVEIHNENLHDESLPFAFDPKFPESDHAPFVAEFS